MLRKLAISAAIVFASAQALAAPNVDQPAPGFVAKAADGSTVDLSKLKGKTVVLEWTNHQCPFVVKHYDRSSNIPNLQKDATNKGVVWLQVVSSAPGNQGYVDGPAAIKANQTRNSAPTNTLLDPEGTLGKLYGAKTTPHIFVINTGGKLVYKGGIDSIKSSKPEDIPNATNYVREALGALSEGKAIPNPVTEPYGCSVKYAG